MDANFTILPDAIGVVDADSKEAILDLVAKRFGEVYHLDSARVLESILEREALGSTGFGHGAAIPHARVDTIKRPIAVLLKLKTPVDFGSSDGMVVNLAFGLLSPVNAGASHLHALAAISRIVRDDEIREAIGSAQNAETIYALLTNVAENFAA